MAYAMNNAEWAAFFLALPGNEITAVPFAWTKADAEGALQEMYDDGELQLTGEEWMSVVDGYVDNKHFNEDSMFTLSERLDAVMERREEGK